LRQQYPMLPTPNIRSHSKCKPASTVSNDADTSSDESCPKLSFLKITSPQSGYILSNIHSYPLLLPGLPTTYTQTDHWLWRVTCQPDGAFIRRGLELVTDHLGTLPYGTVCEVKKKVVNGMGLNRLKIEARLQKDQVVGGVTGRADANEPSNVEADAFGMTKYSGYISEFLNPLSGQRGNVVEPIPFPVPALYKVVHPKGCIVRAGVELSTSQIGFAPPRRGALHRGTVVQQPSRTQLFGAAQAGGRQGVDPRDVESTSSGERHVGRDGGRGREVRSEGSGEVSLREREEGDGGDACE